MFDDDPAHGPHEPSFPAIGLCQDPEGKAGQQTEHQKGEHTRTAWSLDHGEVLLVWRLATIVPPSCLRPPGMSPSARAVSAQTASIAAGSVDLMTRSRNICDRTRMLPRTSRCMKSACTRQPVTMREHAGFF